MAKLAHDLERSCAAAPAELDGLERVFEDTRDALRSALLGDAVTFLLLALAVVAFAIAVLARRAARQASLSEARFRALAAQWPDTATGLLDRDLRFTLFAGDAFAPYWEPGEVIGKLLSEMMPPERFEEARPHVEAAFAGERRTLEWRGVRSNLIFRVDLVPFREHGDEVSHVMLAFRDITDHKALQHSLEEQRGFLSAVLRAARRARHGVRRRRPDRRTSAAATPRAARICTRSSGPRPSACATRTASRSGRTRRRSCARCAATRCATSSCASTRPRARWRCSRAAARSRPTTAAASAPSSSTPT